MSQYEHIRVIPEGKWVSVVMNRPPLNVLNIPMMKELNAALAEARGMSGAHAVLLRAEGKAFSAGVDVADHTSDRVEEMMREFRAVFSGLSAIPVPTIAAVDGAALGGGCEVALGCDMIVASERAKFGQPEIQVGVFPPVAAALLPRLIGRNRTLEFIMNGAPVSAAEAAAIGFVNRVFPVEGFGASAAEFVSKIAAQSRVILEMARRAVDLGLGLGAAEAIDAAEALYMGEMMKTEDASEGLKAFLEKRAPVWRNR